MPEKGSVQGNFMSVNSNNRKGYKYIGWSILEAWILFWCNGYQ